MDFRIENKESFKIIGFSCKIGSGEDWKEFLANYNERLKNDDSWGGPKSYYHAPLWQTEAYSYNHAEGENGSIIGAELGDKPALGGMDVKTFPAATYAVFTITSKAGEMEASDAYARITTEWLPASNYKIDENAPKMEVYLPNGNPNSNEYKWETWLPVTKK